jgi:hypothetical protein
MSEAKKEKRMRCAPFVKRLNYNHLMCVYLLRACPRNRAAPRARRRAAPLPRALTAARPYSANHPRRRPTRYSLDAGLADELSKALVEDALNFPGEAKKDMRKEMRKILEARYAALADTKAAGDKAGAGPLYFFKRLRF